MIKNSIRCCISCILPCGALDVIRIVHCNGRVEEISGSIKAQDIMKAHPKHVLKKPSDTHGHDSNSSEVPKVVILPPDAELKRGKIYFLMPLPPQYQENNIQRKKKKKKKKMGTDSVTTRVVVSDGYLNDIMSEKLSTHRDGRRGRVAVWRPHLESISESPSHLS